MIKKIVILLVLLIPLLLSAQQNNSIAKYETERESINRSGMLVLGGWAALNIISGSIGYFNTDNKFKYFHQFNAAWNVVNMGIAVFSILGTNNNDPANYSLIDSFKEFNSFQNFLLLNAGLDIAYIVTGFYLNERSKNSERNASRLKGYATSLFLQGGFLLAFDLALYFINQNNAELYLFPNISPENHLNFGVELLLKI